MSHARIPALTRGLVVYSELGFCRSAAFAAAFILFVKLKAERGQSGDCGSRADAGSMSRNSKTAMRGGRGKLH